MVKAEPYILKHYISICMRYTEVFGTNTHFVSDVGGCLIKATAGMETRSVRLFLFLQRVSNKVSCSGWKSAAAETERLFPVGVTRSQSIWV